MFNTRDDDIKLQNVCDEWANFEAFVKAIREVILSYLTDIWDNEEKAKAQALAEEAAEEAT